MRILVSAESRLERAPDGSHWLQGPSHYDFWARYLVGFSEVRVLARVRGVPHRPADSNRVDGPGISVAAVPYYVGPQEYLRRYPVIRRVIGHEVGSSSAIMVRLPGQIGAMAYRQRLPGQPFGVEVVADPSAVMSKGVIDHPLRPILKAAITRPLIRATADAASVAYVTRAALQARYPAADDAFTTWYSSVDLPPSAFSRPRERGIGDVSRLVTVGSLDQPYKGIDSVIRALALLRSRGLPAKLTIVGDGRLREVYEAMARDEGVARAVEFAGQVPAGESVRRHLRAADVFILASRTEGLPRAMLEAMASGLPCIGSRVGGIPELLDEGSLVQPGDADAIVRAIKRLQMDPALYMRSSRRSIEVAREYEAWRLDMRRQEHYEALAALAGRWERGRRTGAPGMT